jgi:Arc/MetJ-type ribon-helix-helix transcriptional regulator
MYRNNFETLSISLPAVHFMDDYIAKHESESQSQVIQEALQLLRDREQKQVDRDAMPFEFDTERQERELELAYRDAAQEFDTAWEITASDGLSNETW